MRELAVKWKPALVLLSFTISFLGSYVTVSLSEQYRLAQFNPYKLFNKSMSPNIILLMMGISLGGVAVWSMHFVGMAAIILKDDQSQDVQITYDVGLTTASIFCLITFVYLGLLVASYDRAYTKTKHQILNMVAEDAQNCRVRISSKLSILMLASMKGLGFLVCGGFLAGGGGCSMHYLGMMSQRFDGYMEWNVRIIAVSCVLSIVVAIAGFWIIFRLLALYPHLEWLRVTSAIVMALSVTSMHYTGMYGAKYIQSNSKINPSSNSTMTTGEAFGVALVLGSIISWTFIMIAVRDMRHWHQYCTHVIEKTDAIFRKAFDAPTANVVPFIEKYEILRGTTFSIRDPDIHYLEAPAPFNAPLTIPEQKGQKKIGKTDTKKSRASALSKLPSKAPSNQHDEKHQQQQLSHRQLPNTSDAGKNNGSSNNNDNRDDHVNPIYSDAPTNVNMIEYNNHESLEIDV